MKVPSQENAAPAHALRGPPPDQIYVQMAAAQMVQEFDFYDESVSDSQAINNVENSHGLFGPIKSDMQGPYKEHIDTAKKYADRFVKLWDDGDPDARKAIADFETSRKDDLSAGKLNRSSVWHLVMQLYTGNMADAMEREDITPEQRKELNWRSGFDMEGRPMVNMSRVLEKIVGR